MRWVAVDIDGSYHDEGNGETESCTQEKCFAASGLPCVDLAEAVAHSGDPDPGN